jgi:hypothetical protein
MSKIRIAFGSLWFWTVAPAVLGLAFLVIRNRPLGAAGNAFDFMDGVAFTMLNFGSLWLLFYSVEYDAVRAGKVASAGLPGAGAASEGEDVDRLRAEVSARVREAADFKAALARKDEELKQTRASLNRADLKSINEGIAAFLLSAEFLAMRISAGKAAPDSALPELMAAVDDLLQAAQLTKGMPKPGERLADQPPQSCTIFSKIDAPTPDKKGQLAEVRNSWVGFMSGGQLVIVSPSRVSVYV